MRPQPFVVRIEDAGETSWLRFEIKRIDRPVLKHLLDIPYVFVRTEETACVGHDRTAADGHRPPSVRERRFLELLVRPPRMMRMGVRVVPDHLAENMGEARPRDAAAIVFNQKAIDFRQHREFRLRPAERRRRAVHHERQAFFRRLRMDFPQQLQEILPFP